MMAPDNSAAVSPDCGPVQAVDAGDLRHTTFFSTKEWVEAYCRSSPLGRVERPLAIPVEGSGASRTIYVVETRHWYQLRSISSGYAGDFFLSPGWVGELERSTLERILAQLAGPRTRLRWNVRFDHEPLANGLASLGLPYRREPNYVLLLGRDYEQVFAGYSAATRNHVRKGQRRGLLVREPNSVEEVDAYYQIYIRYAREKGWFVIYPMQLSLDLMKLKDRTRFYVGEFDGRVVSGGMFVRDGPSVYYLHCVSDRAYAHVHPSSAIIDQGIRWACDCGAPYFNLGFSPASSGYAQFKESWGALTEHSWLFEVHSPLWRGPVALFNGKRRLQSALQKLVRRDPREP